MTTPLGADRLLAIAVEAADAGVKSVVGTANRAPVATKSTATDIVTAADVGSERAICEVLAAHTPGARLLAEESGVSQLGSGDHAAVEWVVDPLDGTVNFSYRIPISAVSIAAVVAGVPVAAVVEDVTSAYRFAATLGGGAFVNGEPVAVSPCTELAQALFGTGFAYDSHSRREHANTVAMVVAATRDVRNFGSAALHLCAVASGALDAYAERHIKPWDYAAGSLIAAEAGASVELPCPENRNLVVAATPAIFEPFRRWWD